jgi:hypothetical protein
MAPHPVRGGDAERAPELAVSGGQAGPPAVREHRLEAPALPGREGLHLMTSIVNICSLVK